MSSNSLEISAGVGEVAAILTWYEFIVGTIGAFCLAPFFYGIFLSRLHARGKLTVRKRYLKRKAFGREAVGFALAVWFAISVSVVESSLESELRITDEQVESPSCLRMDQMYDASPILVARPPFKFSIGSWGITIGEQLSCGKRGILSIDLGGNEGIFNTSYVSSAPICDPTDRLVDPFFPELDSGLATINLIDLGGAGARSVEPLIQFFPYDVTVRLSRSRKLGLQEPYINLPSCDRFRIASLPFRYVNQWDISQVDDYNVTLQTMHKICNNVTGVPTTLPMDIIEDCYEAPSVLNMTCVRDATSPSLEKYSSSVVISNLSMLIIKSLENLQFIGGAEFATRSVACPDVSLNISYYLAPLKHLTSLDVPIPFNGEVPLDANLSMFIPHKVEKLRGECEPTLHILGFSALLYTARMDWRGIYPENLSRKQKYKMFLLSMARTIFSIDEFHQQFHENISVADRPVYKLRKTKQVTDILKDWRFYLLIAVTVVCMLFLLSAVLFHVIFPTQAWEISPDVRLERIELANQALESGREFVVQQKVKGRKEEKDADIDSENTELTVEVLNVTSSTSKGKLRQNDISYRLLSGQRMKTSDV